MTISKKIHQLIRLQNILFTVLFICSLSLLAWLSTQYRTHFDWTANNRNSLSQPSVLLLKKLKQPIEVHAYSSDNELLRRQISVLIDKYQHHKADISLSYTNPDLRPDKAREEGITADGELVLYYNGQRESIKRLDEQSLSNALQRLSNSQQRWVVFLQGHGERDPNGKANFDYSIFQSELKNKGINSQTINLVNTPSIPLNTSLLVIADPKSAFLEGEIKLINDYISTSRPILLLGEPRQNQSIATLASLFGIHFLPGTVVDATTQMFAIEDPTFALVTQYSDHVSTRHLQTMSLFPGTAGLSINNNTPYTATAFLSTLERSWTEIGNIEGQIQFDSDTDEQQGPITIGYALSRSMQDQQQRIAVIGDSDFLSNAFLGNGANLDLGLSLIRWLNHDDSLIDIPAKTAGDVHLNISQTWSIVFGLGFLIGLPILFIASGLIIWLKRKQS